MLEFVICGCVLYWLFPSFFRDVIERLSKMVDLVSNRMFETFNRFSSKNNNQIDSLSTISNLKRFSHDLRYKKALSREAEIKHRESQLFSIKENVPEIQLTRTKHLVGLACQQCAMPSRESFVNKTTNKMPLTNLLTAPRERHKLKKFSYELVKDTILEEQKLIDAIQRMSKEQCDDLKSNDFYEEILQGNKERAKKLFYDMKSNLNDFFIKCVVWLLDKIFPRFLQSILVDQGQLDVLVEASQTGLPLVFLPLHRSHLDYLIVSYLMATNNIKSPLVAAGDNLKIPFFGTLLKGLGGFFIKRRIDPIQGRRDHIYKALLHSYIASSLKMGNNIEFYIEGGRSRTGKPLMPKYGVFSVLVDSILDDSLEDVLLVPMSVNYDKLVDGNFTKEQLGEPKHMENFINTIKSLWNTVNGDFGMVKIDLNQPYSLRELIKIFKITNWNLQKKLSKTRSIESIYGIDITNNEDKNLIEATCRHVLYDAAKSTSIMSTNMVAFILLTKYRNGALMTDIINTFENLYRDLKYTQKQLSFQGLPENVINYAINMLGDNLVKKSKINGAYFIEPNLSLAASIELKYYANCLVSHLAMDAIIATSVFAIDNKSGLIDLEELLDVTLELCNILRYEFILCKPCQSLDQKITYHLDELIIRKQIFIRECESAIESRSRRIARDFDDDGEEPFRSIKYEINKGKGAYTVLKELREIIYPLLECYVFTAQSMSKLVGTTMLESELVQEIVADLKEQLNGKTLLHGEAISVDTIKNCLKLFNSWGYLDCHNEGKLRLYYLRENYNNYESVTNIYNRISCYLPEIK